MAHVYEEVMLELIAASEAIVEVERGSGAIEEDLLCGLALDGLVVGMTR